MFPIRDHNTSGRTPYVTIALIAVNIGVFLSYWPLLEKPHELMRFYSTWALIPADSAPYSFLSSMFLHAGFWHISGNMLFLWIFGDNLEDVMGHIGFLLFYLASGIAAGGVHVALSQGSAVPTVGASGAIAGVMGGYLLLYPKARIDILLIIIIYFRVFAVPAWLMLCIWFAMQLFGAAIADPDTGGVAYWAHAGGFVIGALLTLPIWVRLGGPAFWSRNHGMPPHPGLVYQSSSIPAVRHKR